MKANKLLTLLTLFLSFSLFLTAQVDLTRPQEYTIGGITVLGAKTTDVQAIKLFAGLKEGDRIIVPSEKLPKAVKNLWDQDLFSDVTIGIGDVRGENIFLVIEVEERGRLQGYRFQGGQVGKSEEDDLREEIPMIKGKIVNDNLKINSVNAVKKFYANKGFLRTEVRLEESLSPILEDHVLIDIYVDKGPRYKINDISFDGNSAFSEKLLRKSLKKTKERRWYRLFKRSKYVEKEFENDKQIIIAKYNEKGYRNAKILGDTVWDHDSKSVNLNVDIKEGNQFYFGNITWLGNTKYNTDYLNSRMGINKGEVYNRVKLEERLFMSQNGDDVSSLYLDNGYLSFSANPVETKVYNDTIDVEIRMYEGKQYRINQIIIKGNTITNDHVIMREIRTRPGDLFSRSDIIRTQRELSQLGYFNPEGFGINPIQNPSDGTVDIEYTVEEKPSDQVELQGGWGAGRVVGTLGLSFNNFSIKNVFNGDAWRPVPKGDGQRLSLRAQTNG
ncbi:MAG: outer membrane protein assembly factor BamA, partial [Flavobacteriales bacterium]|nr:outer membrane protein assembly factor BamA [Flavobacteriales bacterium]